MKNKHNNLRSIILAIIMLLTMAPIQVFTAETVVEYVYKITIKDKEELCTIKFI